MMHFRTYKGRGHSIRRAAAVAAALVVAFAAVQASWALPGTQNLSLLPGVTATANPSAIDAAFDTPPKVGIDGNSDGNYGNGSVFYHNANPDSPPLFYQVDLGANEYIDRVQILRRTDASDGVFGNMSLSIFQDDGTGNPGAQSFSQSYNSNYFGSGTWGTTDPGAPSRGGASGGTFGRFVRFERLDNNYWLDFAEFEVIGNKTPLAFTDANNIAIDKPVTTSSAPGFGALMTSGNDGNIDGSFGNGTYRPEYHSSNFGVGEFWQVDLGAVKQLDHLQLFSRGDDTTTTQFKVTVYGADDATVAGSFLIDNNAQTSIERGYDHVVNTMGISGQFIKIETTNSEYLAFSELRAFVGPGSAFPVGDYDQNGVVDIHDFNTWKLNFGSTTFPAADGNGNNVVDAGDYTIWRDNFGRIGSSSGSGGLGSQGVPEPSSIVLMLSLAVLAPLRKRWSFTKQS